MSNDTHISAYIGAEESLRQAIALVNYVFRHLTAGDLRLTAGEADNMHAHLQELVLQAAAVGGCIRQQQAGHSPLYTPG